MPDGSRPSLPYPSPPSPDDECIVAAIRASRPEDIPGLEWTPPDFMAEGHRIVRKFDIDRKKRPDGLFIPCAMCSGGHPKFLLGSILWSPDGKLRLIGHVCAEKEGHFGKAGYGQLLKLREQEERDSLALAWMEANIAAIGPTAASVAGLRPIMSFWEEQQRKLFHDVPLLAKRIAKIAARDGGLLTVTQESSSAQLVEAATRDETDSQRKERNQYETVALGTFFGRSFLSQPRTKRSLRLEGILRTFREMPDGEPQEQLLALFDGGERAVTTMFGLILQAMRQAAALADECVAAQAFFRENNLTLLERWGSDRRNPQQFTVRRYVASVEFRLPDRSRAVLQTGWPPMPDLSVLRRLVADGK